MKLTDIASRIQCGLASAQDFDGLGKEDVLAIKGDQSEMHTRFLGGEHAVELVSRIGKGGEKDAAPSFRHIASDESVDAMGDIIRVAGWELDRFNKNPVLLWAHNQNDLPIGTVDKVWKGRTGGMKALMTESSFHSADLNPHADMVRGLVEAGALPGVSVGFVPKEMFWPESEEVRRSLGLGPMGVEHRKSELLELSVVPVPANGNALRTRCIEAAEPVFALAEERGWEAGAVEFIRRALNFEDTDERAIRRRTIVVPDGAHALLVERQVEAPSAEEPPTPETPKENTDGDLKAAIETLTASVAALTENLTKSGTVASEKSVEVADEETTQKPDGPGEDFAVLVARAAAEQLSQS